LVWQLKSELKKSLLLQMQSKMGDIFRTARRNDPVETFG